MKRVVLTALVVGFLALSGRPAATAEESQRLPRSYPGAPPFIPHEVEPRKGLCLTCHATGVADAPIVPHPTRDPVCLECHVGQERTAKPFQSQGKPVKE